MVVFIGIFVWGATVYFDAYRAPDDSAVVYVVGKQWMWKFQHPEGQREINELHVPLGKPCKLMLTSEDVIHSFFVPRFSRSHGRFAGPLYQCLVSAHADGNFSPVLFAVLRHQPRRHDWPRHCHGTTRNTRTGCICAPRARWPCRGGRHFSRYRCLSCHSADANARAPVLEELFGKPVHLRDGRTVLADEDYLRESIMAPGAKIVVGWDNIMPTFQGQVSQEETNELIAFIKSLRKGETPRRVEAYPPPLGTPPINPGKELR